MLFTIHGGSLLHPQCMKQILQSSCLNLNRWKSKKSGEQSNFNLVSIRSFSGSSQGYRMLTSSDQHCKENVTLLTTFDLLWILWRLYLHFQVHTKKNLLYNVMIHCPLDSLPVHFIIPSDLSSPCLNFETSPPFHLSPYPGWHLRQFTPVIGQARNKIYYHWQTNF
jgi:hypothetical protein